MKSTYKSLLLITLPLTTLGCLTFLGTARAQITPDTSLGAESSVVTPNVEIRGTPSDRIDGGAIRGNNLFHSFSDFNINPGRGAYFSNPSGIANILSRVTEGNPSNIGGTLGVLGNGNLFFANPNGVIFGPNARLDVSGSFFASTADSFIFDNGFEFSASNPQAPPLLTVNIPVGLRFRENPGSISNAGTLAAPQDLTLAAGNLDLQGQVYAGRDLKLQAQDTLKIHNARLEASVIDSASTNVILEARNDITFNAPINITTPQVELTGMAGNNINVNENIKTTGGDIILAARNLNIDMSRIATRGGNFTAMGSTVNFVSTLVTTDAQDNTQRIGGSGNIRIKTNPLGSVTLKKSEISADSQEGIGGNIELATGFLNLYQGTVSAETNNNLGGNINIRLTNLLMRRESLISTTTRGGVGGGITIYAPDGFIISFPKENNDITANSFDGDAGGIDIVGLLHFGFVVHSRANLVKLLGNDPNQLNPRNLSTNDITSFKQKPNIPDEREFVVSGTTNFDFARRPPVILIDPREIIAQNPCRQGVGSEFVVTGRGGLPLSPTQTTRSETVQVDLVKPAPQQNRGNSQKERIRSSREEKQTTSNSPATKQILPAQGWVVKHNGEVVLTAHNPTNKVTLRSRRTPGICSGR